MARIRTVKPEFWTDSKTGTLSGLATKLFLGMLNHADDVGVLRFNPLELKAQILPYEAGSPDEVVVRPLVDEIFSRGLAVPFLLTDDSGNIPIPFSEHSGSVPGAFLRIPNFLRHQRIDKPGLPLLPEWERGDTWETFSSRRRECVNENIDIKQIDMTSMPVHSNTIPGTIPERSNTILAGKERKGVERKGKDISDPDGSPVPAVSELPPKEPKPPPENAAASLRLSWAFYVLRKRAEGDEYFDPYGDKHLGQCKQIVEKKANGNTEEATRRANNLFEYWKQKPDYWKLTPGDLLSKWESLNKGPEDKSGSATAAAMDAAR